MAREGEPEHLIFVRAGWEQPACETDTKSNSFIQPDRTRLYIHLGFKERVVYVFYKTIRSLRHKTVVKLECTSLSLRSRSCKRQNSRPMANGLHIEDYTRHYVFVKLTYVDITWETCTTTTSEQKTDKHQDEALLHISFSIGDKTKK